ncbi:hypothetical protein [Selenomonas ruminantium]|uniref:hypothetical protein n=1 Tax=Selenomonas ruminantium TaxID=971 RepID=UPI0026F22A92|nr:hypothetical protein [Selenomonas ruminantium]
MIDTDKLRQAVNTFVHQARPSDSNRQSPATIGDINKLIDRTATVLNQFIDEIEKGH